MCPSVWLQTVGRRIELSSAFLCLVPLLLWRCNCKFSCNTSSVTYINCHALITRFANESLQGFSLSVTPDNGSGPIRCEQCFLPFSELPSQLPRSCRSRDLTWSQMAYLAVCQWSAAVSIEGVIHARNHVSCFCHWNYCVVLKNDENQMRFESHATSDTVNMHVMLMTRGQTSLADCMI